MSNSLYVLLSNQIALKNKMDTVANNMANMNTTGFKEENVQFEDIFKSLQTDGRGVHFVHDAKSSTNFKQGALMQTGNSLDIVVSQDTMLSVRDQNGNQFYTKDGRLSRNAEGTLVLTSNGMALLDDAGGEIQIPPNVQNIFIAKDGTISSQREGILGKVGQYHYNAPAMKRLSDGLFTAPAPLEAAENGTIIQGFLEKSNVNAVKTLTEMIEVQRNYEKSANLIQKEDQKIKDMLSRIGRVDR